MDEVRNIGTETRKVREIGRKGMRWTLEKEES